MLADRLTANVINRVGHSVPLHRHQHFPPNFLPPPNLPPNFLPPLSFFIPTPEYKQKGPPPPCVLQIREMLALADMPPPGRRQQSAYVVTTRRRVASDLLAENALTFVSCQGLAPELA
jgi:hypothetical protein